MTQLGDKVGRFLAVALLLALAAGCSSKKGYKVAGKVLVNGQPAGGATVVLSPAGNPQTMDKKPNAMTRDDGTFELSTLADGDGVEPGDYLVTITWPGKPKPSARPKGMSGGDDERATTPDQLRGKYADPQSSGLKITVKPEANELAPFDLKN